MAGSGLESLMPAGLQVVNTTKQLWWWGWTQISQDFLASDASPVEADGRRVWVWGASTALIVVMSRGTPSVGPPCQGRSGCCGECSHGRGKHRAGRVSACSLLTAREPRCRCGTRATLG